MNIIFLILQNTALRAPQHSAFLLGFTFGAKPEMETGKLRRASRGSPRNPSPGRARALPPRSRHKPVQPPGDPLESLFNQVKKTSMATALFVCE